MVGPTTFWTLPLRIPRWEAIMVPRATPTAGLVVLMMLIGHSPGGSTPGRRGSLPETAPWLATPKSWEAVLAPAGEPGGRFVMEGRLLGPDGKTGMAGIKMFSYHADRDGQYAKQGGKYMRLAGVRATDSTGRYRIASTLPGQYEGPAHVHFEAWGPGLPLRLWFVNLYRGPKERPDSLWGRLGGPSGPLHSSPPEVYVTRDARGVFRARCDLFSTRGFEASAHDDSTRRGLVAN